MIGWSKINLGDLATFHNGYAFKPEDWSTSGKEIIRIQNLTKGSAQINYFQGEIADKYKVRHDDVLISWSGSLGVYIWHGKDAWLNQHLFKVVFNKENLDKSFFIYLISNSLKKLEAQVHGATMKHITKKKFDAFPVNLPPLEQQKKIAAILDAADAYRQKTKALIEKYDELTQSLFLDMFGDPKNNTKDFQRGLIGDFIKIHGGSQPPKSLFKTELIEGYVRLVQIRDYKSDKYLTYIPENATKKFCTQTDIMIGRYGPPVFQILRGISGAYNVALMKATPLKGLHSEYIFHLLSCRYIQDIIIGNSQRTAGQTGVNLKLLNSIEVSIPPIELQNKFAERVQTIELQKAQAQASLAQAEDLFNSLLQRAFKGELTN